MNCGLCVGDGIANAVCIGDLVSLRNGITLVIDTSNAPKKKVGNERKLQVAWQNYPTRPQHIFIMGTSALTRAAAS